MSLTKPEMLHDEGPPLRQEPHGAGTGSTSGERPAPPDSLRLLRLTAELHAAVREPERWPYAWQALRQCFDCPEVFGATAPPSPGEAAWSARLTVFREAAIACARSCERTCGGQPDLEPVQRAACAAVVEHLGHVLAGMSITAPFPSLAALDALTMPMLLCRIDRELVFANHAARREISRGRWLTEECGVIHAADPDQDMRLAAACSRLGAALGGSEDWLPGMPAIGETADLSLRRLGSDESDAGQPLILLSLVVHAGEPNEEILQRLGERRKLSPRQRELAGHLLAGLSLDEAALCMGIGRRTARDHLKGLFRATGSSRQAELIARLSRETLG